ncbi:RHS repeat-associated core domain-containing protein, partial [Chitinophaga ginsengisoli]
DNEVKGEGNQQDYGMRVYDPRLGKFLSVDPLTKSYPELTPYQFASNNPIFNIDLDGAEGTGGAAKVIETGGKTALRVAAKNGVIQGAKIVSMQAVEKAVESPGFWKSLGFGLGRIGSAVGGAIIWTFTPVPNGPGANPEASTWWQEYRRLQDMPNTAPVSGKSFMEEDESDYITLHRGVSADAKYPVMFALAEMGIAVPMSLISPIYRGGGLDNMIPGHTVPEDHSMSDNYSIWTSWTSSESTAATFARGTMGTSNGVILTKTFKRSLLTVSSTAHEYGESEYLVPGIVTGAKIDKIKGDPTTTTATTTTTTNNNNSNNESSRIKK